MRTVRSAAINLRASRVSMPRKASLNPRTPVNAPTPSATATITKTKRVEDARASRHAILTAVLRTKFISHHQAVLQLQDAVGMLCKPGIVRHHHHGGTLTLI